VNQERERVATTRHLVVEDAPPPPTFTDLSACERGWSRSGKDGE
jgi:hypothetical protein